MRRAKASTLLALTMVGGANTTLGAAIDFEAKLDALVRKAGITPESPGVAIMIKDATHIILKKAYGLAKLQPKTPLTPQTLCELASVSKTMTSTAVLLLVDRGKLALSDEVRKYLPELPDYGNGHATIKDLLQHTSGLPDYLDIDDPPMKNGAFSTNDDFIAGLAAHASDLPAKAHVGAKQEYNNTNYLLLASVIERVARVPFATFMHAEIFQPLGMTHTFVNQTPTPLKDGVAAVGYAHGAGGKKMNGGGAWKPAWGIAPDRQETNFAVGDGSIWSSLEDMAKWDDAVRARRLLASKTWDAALVAPKTSDGHANDYGLGWMLYADEPGAPLNGYGHEGSWIFQTSYYYHIASGRTTIILSNRDDFDPDAFWYKIEEL